MVENLVAIGTTTNMSVSWYKPMGQVDNYTVTIYKNNVMENNRTITNNYLQVVFQNLKPGNVYVVKVATNSGPLTEALNVTNATCKSVNVYKSPTFQLYSICLAWTNLCKFIFGGGDSTSGFSSLH